MRCEGDLVDSCDSRNGVGDDVVVLKLKKRLERLAAATRTK
jgi:hypothetical protein